MSKSTNPEVGTKADEAEDQNTGDGGTDATKDTSGSGTGTASDNQPEERTFTQEELNRIVKRETSKLEPDAEAWRKHKQETATEEEKRQREQEERDRQIAEREQRANERLLRASIIEASREANIDPEFEDLVIESLMRADSVEVTDEGEVKGVEKALKKMVESKPKLVAGKKAPGQSGAEFGGQESKTLDEQISAAEAKGDWRLSRQLKLQKLSNA